MIQLATNALDLDRINARSAQLRGYSNIGRIPAIPPAIRINIPSQRNLRQCVEIAILPARHASMNMPARYVLVRYMWIIQRTNA